MGAGATRLPEVDAAKPPPAREAPPPQNPAPIRKFRGLGKTGKAATGTLTPARYRTRSAVEHSVVVDRTLAQRAAPRGLSLINRYFAARRRCR